MTYPSGGDAADVRVASVTAADRPRRLPRRPARRYRRPVRRILIVGSAGAGKSTLAREVARARTSR